MGSPLIPLWRVALFGAIAFALTMALLPHPPHLLDVSDKWQHMAAFATLSLLAALAFPATPLTRIGERLSFLGAMIEVLQSIPALHRDCDIWDWVADTTMIVIVLTVIGAFRRFHRPRLLRVPFSPRDDAPAARGAYVSSVTARKRRNG
jgi:hypothetical protein